MANSNCQWPNQQSDIANKFLVLTANIDDKPAQCILDTEAAICVVKGFLTTPTPPKAKLKLKGVLSGTGTLYGPKLAKFDINGKSYNFQIYEAEIQEDCLIGLNFIPNFFCVIDPVACKMAIHSPSYNSVDLTKSKNPPSTLFHTGYQYFKVRTSKVLNLQPGEKQ